MLELNSTLRLSSLREPLQSGYGKRDDKLDAYLSAWVASLDENDRIPLGMRPHDVIWVPKIKPLIIQDEFD